jgi:RNA polymerase sigma-70 factor, ECF subfamily
MSPEQLSEPIGGIRPRPSSSYNSLPPRGYPERRARSRQNSASNDVAYPETKTPRELISAHSQVTSRPGEITELLKQLKDGNREAEATLMPLVYEQLRRLAGRYLRWERREHTLQRTALVHEAYIKLIGQRRVSWQSRGHFYRLTARLMRRILVDHARKVRVRGGGHQVPLEPEIAHLKERPAELLAIDEALDRLAEREPRRAQVVELRFFAGHQEEEIAQILGISVRSVKRDWRAARAWLLAELSYR